MARTSAKISARKGPPVWDFFHTIGAGGSPIAGKDLFASTEIRGGIEASTGVAGGDPLAFQVLGLLESAFGDGSDGHHTVVGTETLTRDMYYDDLTVPVGTVLITNSFRVFVKGVLTVNGTMHNDGGVGEAVGSNFGGKGGGHAAPTAASIAGASAAETTGTVGAGANGGGQATAGGDSPNAKGGEGGSATGAAGVRTRAAAGSSYASLLPYVITGADPSGALFTGGAGGGGVAGGGGGGGGGVVLISARSITGSGTIRSNGGNGAPAAGNGAGGGGGFIILAFGALDEAALTIQANAGANIGGGTVGGAGEILRAHIVS